MARIRKTEPEVTVSAAAAAPARRKAVTAPRKPRLTATKAPAEIKAAGAIKAMSAAVEFAVEPVVVPAPANDAPANEEIAALAYSYWVARGYQDGSPEQDWLRAEQELLQRAL